MLFILLESSVVEVCDFVTSVVLPELLFFVVLPVEIFDISSVANVDSPDIKLGNDDSDVDAFFDNTSDTSVDIRLLVSDGFFV